jgi:hypothetical protein
MSPPNPLRTPLNSRALPPDRRVRPLPYAKAVGAMVPKITAKAFECYGFHTAEIMTQWAAIAGAELAAMAQPARIKWPRGGAAADDGKLEPAALILNVDPARALEIEYRAHEIADRINRYFGYRAIGTVKVVQVPLKAAPQPGSSMPRETPREPQLESIGGQPDGLSGALHLLGSNVALRLSGR